MGEECPLPGNGIFQRILLVSLQRIGGLACGATPLANGPRHCGQLFQTAALSQAPPPSASADTASRQPRLGNNRSGGIIRYLSTPCSSRLKAAIPLTASLDRACGQLTIARMTSVRIVASILTSFL